MANSRFYTQENLANAKQALSELPDLTPNKLTTSDILVGLNEQIIALATTKGYTAADIKSALESVGINTSVRRINDILRSDKISDRKRKRTKAKNQHHD